MADYESPTLRRWALAAALRQLRETAGKTIEQVSAELTEQLGPGFSAAKISRMETGKRGIIPRDVRDLCVYYQVPAAERDRLVELARKSRERDVWQKLHEALATFVTLESIANRIRTYESVYVPGLLQTVEYSSVVEGFALFDDELPAQSNNLTTEERIALRKERQDRLLTGNQVAYHAIVDENVLRRTLGEPAIMRGQLEHLIEVAQSPNITVQVIPLSTPLYPGSEASAFVLLDFPDEGIAAQVAPGPVCFVEGILGALWAERADDVRRINRVFRHMSELALPPEASLDLIREILRQSGAAATG